jgi:predicted lipoprotein
LAVGAILLAAVALASCKILPTVKATPAQGKGVDVFFNDKSFDPDKMVADMWETKVIPYLTAKAGPFGAVLAESRSDPAGAGRTYGYRSSESEPFIVAVRIEGRIVAANMTSRAATIDVDTEGDGKTDAIVQIGPAVNGTLLRDALDFVSFTSFRNQIDFAKFGKAFNTYVVRTSLAALPRDALVGKHVSALGVFALAHLDQPPLVTPAQLKITSTP